MMAEKYIFRVRRTGIVSLECFGQVFDVISYKGPELPFLPVEKLLKNKQYQNVRPICCSVMDENQSSMGIIISADAKVEFIDETA